MILINVFFMFISWRVATHFFERGFNLGGWLNLFASAFNGAIVAKVLFT